MKYFFLVCFHFIFSFSFAQDINKFYALDSNLNETVLDSSKYILWVHKLDNSDWQFDYYRTWGPLVKTQTFADREGTILNGRSSRYNSFGNLDSTGIFDHGKKNGSFFKLKSYTPDSIVTVWQTDYVNDSVVKSIDLLATRKANKNVDTASGKESEFPGGKSQWMRYLLNNLKYPERAQSKEIQGQVRIFFQISKEGNISDPYILKSLEYSLDQESMRIVNNSGQWEPALKEGVPVNSYKIQPLNYRLETQ